MLNDCGYFEANLACYSDKKNSSTDGSRTGKVYYWYNDNSLDFSNLYDAKSSGSSGSSNNTIDDDELRAFLPTVKSHIVSIVIWSTNALDTLECIDDNALSGFTHLSSVHFLVPVTYLGDGLFNHTINNRPGAWLKNVNFYGGVQFFENECFKNAGTSDSNINFIKPATVTESGGPRVYIRRPFGPKDQIKDSNWSSDYGLDASTVHEYDHEGISSQVNYITNSSPIYIGQSAFENCKMKLNFLTIDSASEVWYNNSAYSLDPELPEKSLFNKALGGSNETALSNNQSLPSSENIIYMNQFKRGLMASQHKICYFGFNDNTTDGIQNYIQDNKGHKAFYNCEGLSNAYMPVQFNAGNQISTGSKYSGEYSHLFAMSKIKGVKIYPHIGSTGYATINIPTHTFYGCNNLESLKLYTSEAADIAYNIQHHAFKQCTSLMVPNNLLENATYIYHWAFEDVNLIGDSPGNIINFNKLKKLGQGAFAGTTRKVILHCKGLEFPKLTDIGEGVLSNTSFYSDYYQPKSLSFSKNLTIIRAVENNEFADHTGWYPTQPFGGAEELLKKITLYQISGYNLTQAGGNDQDNNFIPQQDGILPNVTQLTIISPTQRKDFEFDELLSSIILPNSLQNLNLHTPIKLHQKQTRASIIWFDSWKTFRNTVIEEGWNNYNKETRQLSMGEIAFDELEKFDINTIYSDFIESFNENSLPGNYQYNWVNYQILHNTKHKIKTLVLYNGENTTIRDALLPCNINNIMWPIQELIVKQDLPNCSHNNGQNFNQIYRPLENNKAFVVDYSANTNYSVLKHEHFFHALAWPDNSSYTETQINVVLNDNITIIEGSDIFYGKFRLQDMAHRASNDEKSYYAFPNLKRIYNTSAFLDTFLGVVETEDKKCKYWISNASHLPTLLLYYELPTDGTIDLGETTILPNLEVIQDGALQLPQGINTLSLILPWTGTSFRQVNANEGTQIKTIFSSQSNIQLSTLTIQNKKNSNVISTDNFPLLSGFVQLDTLILDGENSHINGKLINDNENLIIGNLTVKQGVYDSFFKWCKNNLFFKAIDQDKIQLTFDRSDVKKTITIPSEFFSNKIQVLDKCDLILGTMVIKIYYEWNTSIFKDLIDVCWYKGQYSDWGINLNLANTYCNPIAIARELKIGDNDDNHQITGWNFEGAINPVVDTKAIRSYTYAGDPFLNSVNLAGVQLIQDGAFLGAKAIREFYSSDESQPIAVFFNKGLNKTIWKSYINTKIETSTQREAKSTSTSETGGE